MLSRGVIVEVRRQALRKRCWYRALDNLERGILNLTAELLDAIQSSTLLDQVTTIIGKLRYAFKSSYTRHAETYGLSRFKQMVEQARLIGYAEVKALMRDQDYSKYLVFIDFNQPLGWRLNPKL